MKNVEGGVSMLRAKVYVADTHKILMRVKARLRRSSNFARDIKLI